MIILTLLRNSLPVQVIALALMAWAALGANNLYQRHVGASRVAAQIEKKADEQASTADAVRTDVASGKRGVRRDPFKRDGE